MLLVFLRTYFLLIILLSSLTSLAKASNPAVFTPFLSAPLPTGVKLPSPASAGRVSVGCLRGAMPLLKPRPPLNPPPSLLLEWMQVVRKSAPTPPEKPPRILQRSSTIKACAMRSVRLIFHLKKAQEVSNLTFIGLDSRRTQVARLSQDRPHLSWSHEGRRISAPWCVWLSG